MDFKLIFFTLIKQGSFLSGRRFGPNMTEEKVAPDFYVPRPRVEENSAKNRGFAIAGETPASVEGAQSSGIPKTGDRLFFGTSSYGVGFRRSTSLIFWETVQPSV
jgi:hypothetical protein